MWFTIQQLYLLYLLDIFNKGMKWMPITNIYSDNNDCEKVAITDNYEINLIALYVSLGYNSVLLNRFLMRRTHINENELRSILTVLALYRYS